MKRRPVVAKWLAIHRSQVAGRGVFTHEDIEKGEFILKTGIPRGFYLLCYLNHSCKPNARLEKGRDRYSDCLFAAKDMRVGKDGKQELTIDYRHTRWGPEYFFGKIQGVINQSGGCRCPVHRKKKR